MSDEPDTAYDATAIAGFFDAYASDEWDRFDREPLDRVSLEIHTQMLRETISAGDRVLDAGAGPGRFTIELARLGATVVVGDISPVQLRLNEEKLREAGWETAVERRLLLDVTDLSAFADAGFDAVVCFGGPISYVRARGGDAIGELVRVLRPGGHLLVGVMSRLGAHRIFLEYMPKLIDELGAEAVDSVFETGDLPGAWNNGHAMRLYTAAELRDLLASAGCEVIAMSASNWITAQQIEAPLTDEVWELLLRWELVACREPGALDGGTHILAAARRPLTG
jgi:SAM-dependent methyltransferase